MEQQLSTGTVKWYNSEKGYGFIQVPGETADIFVHAKSLTQSGIAQALKTGEQVKFAVENGPKGKYATNISRYDGNGSAGT